MAQFDVYKNPNAALEKDAPYVVQLQHDFLDHLVTRVIAPLFKRTVIRERFETIHPEIKFNGKDYVLLVSMLAGVQKKILAKPLGNVGESRNEIRDALDEIVSGI